MADQNVKGPNNTLVRYAEQADGTFTEVQAITPPGGTGNSLTLLSNASSTGSYTTWNGGVGVFQCVGTFGGATVTLQVQGPDGSTALTVGTDTTLTASGVAGFVLPACSIRAAVTGGSPSGLYATAKRA